MAALYTELAKLSLPELEMSVLETVVTTDNYLGLLPIRDVSPSIQIQWTEFSTYGTANTASLIAPDGTFTPSSASYTSRVQNMTFCGDSFNLPIALSTPQAIAENTLAKSYVVARKMGDSVINGTTATANCNFTGMQFTVSGSSTQDFAVASVGSGSFSLATLDQAIQAVKLGKPNLIVTSNAGLRYFKAALRTAAGGAQTDMLQIPNYGTPFLSYEGIPIVASDWIGKEVNGGESVYCVFADEARGVRLWSNYGQLAQVIGPTPVINSVSQNYTVGASFGMIVPTLAVSRIYGITG